MWDRSVPDFDMVLEVRHVLVMNRMSLLGGISQSFGELVGLLCSELRL
jgi:hypothetical protein